MLWETGGGRKRKDFTGRMNYQERNKDRGKWKRVRGLKLSQHPIENLYWLQRAWRVKPFKGFSFINATNSECPDLSDKSPLSPLPSNYRFPTESKWENSILCFCFLCAYRIFFWLLDACGDPGVIEVLYFPAPELLHVSGHSQQRGRKVQKWCSTKDEP